MFDTIDEYMEFARVTLKFKEIFDEQKRMINQMISALENKGRVFVGQGPTGMGKSLVIDIVGMYFSDRGKRVLISSPNYPQLIENHDNQLKKLQRVPGISRGKSYYEKDNYLCPSIDPEKKKLCTSGKCMEKECVRYKEITYAKKAIIVLTVHHKIASIPAFPKNEKFDIVIIDESHNLPDIIENRTYESKSRTDLNKFIGDHKNLKTNKILSLDSSKIKKMHEKQLLSELKKIPFSESRTRHWTKLEYNSKSDDFTIHMSYRKVENYGDLSVGLISATIEDPIDHIRDCNFSSLISVPPFQIDSSSKRFVERFERRPVFVLRDGPILRKDESESYVILRQVANALIEQLLLNFKDVVTLVLCRSKDDSSSILQYMNQNKTLRPLLSSINDNDQEQETEELEKLIQQEIDQGRKLIITTAKSKLWEGANIPLLKCVIIDSLPYKRPNPDELKKDIRLGFQRKSIFRFMIRRLQQGIGRLVRSDGDWGIAIIIDGRMYSGKNMINSKLPGFIKDFIFEKSVDEIVDASVKMRKKLEKGNTVRKKQSLIKISEKNFEKNDSL